MAQVSEKVFIACVTSLHLATTLSFFLDFPVHTFLPYLLVLKAQDMRISSRGHASFAKWLHDGKVLRALINAIRPTSAARDMGVQESSMCVTPDLYEEISLHSVVQWIHALGAVQVNIPEVMRPKLGTPLTAQSSDKCNDGSATDQSKVCRWATQAERPGLTSQRRRSIRISTETRLNKSCSRRCETRGRKYRRRSSKR